MTECKTEYITKEQALEAILSTVELTGEQRMQVWNKIKSIPAADVAPVVHAKWKRISSYDEDRNADFICTNCGAGDRHAMGVEVPHCWKCGVKMGGGESND